MGGGVTNCRKINPLAGGRMDLLGSEKRPLWVEQRGEGNAKQRCHQG